MYIKTITYDENKRPITFNDVRFGQIFRITVGDKKEEYYIKIKPVKASLFPANAINLLDGSCAYIEEEAKTEVYAEKSIALDENKFMRGMEINKWNLFWTRM